MLLKREKTLDLRILPHAPKSYYTCSSPCAASRHKHTSANRRATSLRRRMHADPSPASDADSANASASSPHSPPSPSSPHPAGLSSLRPVRQLLLRRSSCLRNRGCVTPPPPPPPPSPPRPSDCGSLAALLACAEGAAALLAPPPRLPSPLAPLLSRRSGTASRISWPILFNLRSFGCGNSAPCPPAGATSLSLPLSAAQQLTAAPVTLVIHTSPAMPQDAAPPTVPAAPRAGAAARPACASAAAAPPPDSPQYASINAL